MNGMQSVQCRHVVTARKRCMTPALNRIHCTIKCQSLFENFFCMTVSVLYSFELNLRMTKFDVAENIQILSNLWKSVDCLALCIIWHLQKRMLWNYSFFGSSSVRSFPFPRQMLAPKIIEAFGCLRAAGGGMFSM